jgi:hypothetical protein
MGRFKPNVRKELKEYRGVLVKKTHSNTFLIRKVMVSADGVNWEDYKSHVWLKEVSELRMVKTGSTVEFKAAEYDYESRMRHDPMRSSVWSKVGLEHVRSVRAIS